ncbi:MAG: hypothetical protein BWX70_02985 [Verrucomicrobia bacterium ADurb.Bin070]|nr:MAG: hypothetical protein BWX70_02985 [Verrucomicrobia bacterium ADurb.Bin070]
MRVVRRIAGSSSTSRTSGQLATEPRAVPGAPLPSVPGPASPAHGAAFTGTAPSAALAVGSQMRKQVPWSGSDVIAMPPP